MPEHIKLFISPDNTVKGYIFAALAAIFYGVNPAFAVPLYYEGMNPVSVLFFRYLLGLPLLFIILLKERNLDLKKTEFFPIAFSGLLMAISSLALYEAYNYMNAGVASTLLFMYPVLTAMLMAAFFHEKIYPATYICLVIMACGLYLLSWTEEGTLSSMAGLGLILLSSLTYAIYLVMVNVSKTIACANPLKVLFYQLIFGVLLFIILSIKENFTIPCTITSWVNILVLAFIPTILSLLCTLKAISCIGPTPTAIFGALEPVTAVFLSMLLLGESMTVREAAGCTLIICATLLVVLSHRINRIFKYFYDGLPH